MQIYVLSSTLAQKYGRICVNDIGRNTGKKLVCDWLHFLRESVIKFAGCGNFNILGRSRVQRGDTLRRFWSIVWRHLTGKWRALLWKLKICSRHRDAWYWTLILDSKIDGNYVYIYIYIFTSKWHCLYR